MYFYRNRKRFTNWQAVIIYPTRSTEQTKILPYQSLLTSPQVHRIYLNELGALETLPLGLGLMVLTTLSEKQAPKSARLLIRRTQAEILQPTETKLIIDLITTIMVYRFTHLSRQEIKAMLGITEVTLQQSRFYQEIKEEGREEGREEALLEVAANLLRQGLTVEQVATATGLEVAQIEEKQQA